MFTRITCSMRALLRHRGPPSAAMKDASEGTCAESWCLAPWLPRHAPCVEGSGGRRARLTAPALGLGLLGMCCLFRREAAGSKHREAGAGAGGGGGGHCLPLAARKHAPARLGGGCCSCGLASDVAAAFRARASLWGPSDELCGPLRVLQALGPPAGHGGQVPLGSHASCGHLS